MIDRDHVRQKLLEKCQGPQALALDLLVMRGNAAAERVVTGYSDYLALLMQTITAVTRHQLWAWGPESWEEFHRTVRDLKRSAAMAGEKWIFTYAQMLEVLLMRHDRTDPNLTVVIRLFLTAIKAAAERTFDGEELDNLQHTLSRVSSRLSNRRKNAAAPYH